MCVKIFTNANGPMLLHLSSLKCNSNSRSIFECNKRDLTKILADCQYNPQELKFTAEQIQKIQSAAQYDYRCTVELLKNKNI